MATVADAARPVGAYPPPVRHGICRLTVRIGGMDYRLRPCPPEPGILAAWALRKLDHDSARYLVTAPKGKPAHCSCPDHERSGWTCKHISSLTALGLIPAPKPSAARARKLHAKNARQAIAEAKALGPQARAHLASMGTGEDPSVPSVPATHHPSPATDFAAGFRGAIAAHLDRLRGEPRPRICELCGEPFDPAQSRDPLCCLECAEGGAA